MENGSVNYKREKIAVIQKIEKEIITDLNLSIGSVDNDFIHDTMTVQLSGYIYSDLSEERELVYYFDKPSFLDWLLGRPREAKFILKVKDLLLNPPKQEDTMRIYIVENPDE